MKKTLNGAVADIYRGNDSGFRYSFYQHVVFGYRVLHYLEGCDIVVEDRVKNICSKIDSIMNVDRREMVDGQWILREADRIRRNPFTARRMRLLLKLYGELHDLLYQNKVYRAGCFHLLVPLSDSAGCSNINGVLYAIREWLEWRSNRNCITLLWSRIWSRING